MGYIKHHAILVTTWDKDRARELHAQALTLFPNGTDEARAQVTALHETETNGFYTFIILPDGSKEGWAESDWGDNQRELFIAHVLDHRYEDGSSPVQAFEVWYDEEDRCGVRSIISGDDGD